MAARIIDPENEARLPRAPSQAEWEQMAPNERKQCVEALPSWMTEAEFLPPEGDPHRDAKNSVIEPLREYYRRLGRKIYIGSDLIVYYPGEPRFAPDVLAVTDVEPHPRIKWVVSHEGKGLDWVLEVHFAGNRRKDLVDNVEFYAHLGIPEYFVYDYPRQRLTGYRLPTSSARTYRPVIPQAGRYRSEVLGLELMLEGETIRFYQGTAQLLRQQELIEKLERYAAEAVERAQQEAERAQQEAERAQQEAERAQQEAERAQQEAERAQQEAERADTLATRVAQLEALLNKTPKP